ncbi:hypothetical protein GCM10017674_05070 [Streptomyces gardneri]|uniref:Uncharacterized protein n=1 Tax=Streptomyces gardneri TaxID=66892 RepID=A0A4Y3RPA2_9ACTN|nr:hypothetical protein SGA01_42020 [Streptomyces gardneri]GHG82979.1 hypothetical protein GCM10017674_05070 [Streptomyces gardneri]
MTGPQALTTAPTPCWTSPRAAPPPCSSKISTRNADGLRHHGVPGLTRRELALLMTPGPRNRLVEFGAVQRKLCRRVCTVPGSTLPA